MNLSGPNALLVIHESEAAIAVIVSGAERESPRWLLPVNI